MMRIRKLLKITACAAFASALTALLALSGPAHAASFWYGAVGAKDTKSSGYVSNIRAIRGYSESFYNPSYPSRKAMVSASAAGTWVDQFDYVCHSYAAGQFFFANLQNPHTVTQTVMSGTYDTSAAC